MGTWNSRGLRGSTLEDMINRTNERYQEQKLALIQKIPTPITPVKMDKFHLMLMYILKRKGICDALLRVKAYGNLCRHLKGRKELHFF